jgi:hypothetical protein
MKVILNDMEFAFFHDVMPMTTAEGLRNCTVDQSTSATACL